MDADNQPNGGVDFEEGLRHILTPGGMEAPSLRDRNEPKPESVAEAPAGERARKYLEAEERLRAAEGKTLFWFKLLRPLAFLALLALLASFVRRIITVTAP